MAGIDRRRFLQRAMVGAASCSWLPTLVQAAADQPSKRRCIVLWMSGGPSQVDTFDLKPGHANGGEFKEIETNVPGLKISEHLPLLAQQADKLAILRGMSTKEGDHQRGAYLMHTGQRPGGPLRYPAIGAALSKELGDPQADLPNFVSVNPNAALSQASISGGFLGPKYAATTVGQRASYGPPAQGDQPMGPVDLGVDYLQLPGEVSADRAEARMKLWRGQQESFLAARDAAAPKSHDTIFRRAVRMMNPDAAAAFDLHQEEDAVREAYGNGRFGQGCLIARRLIERGVPFVEVTHGGDGLGWDTHQGNFAGVKRLSEELDRGWSTLMRELDERGLLESTTILWMGEFGRTPVINGNAGRDHFPDAWSCVLAGGGIAGGQAYGETSEGGEEVVDGKTDVPDMIATLCAAVGVDPARENISPLARPIKISEGAPIRALLS
ncbi:DUF1501 domain-containing protein [Blastopirellula marina]|uniref:DUF1501 domain-containing protein n=1 Tax=Blastopirellula marina TaxID=124 RepID=A0A2S8F2U5_9BACT|nr:DUF1501 domain-containing protein [Blastopirellula marina]PQO26427.1 DUF1501 domain-containing protein [Blastopirellula marina]PQO46938.1 DUF1501 domain-containing protein [Blastopirellula marina]PTL40740.1 DUF1501 domain-containing protein [Blastopirellula marina]